LSTKLACEDVRDLQQRPLLLGELLFQSNFRSIPPTSRDLIHIIVVGWCHELVCFNGFKLAQWSDLVRAQENAR
jgi:hypothetical protein